MRDSSPALCYTIDDQQGVVFVELLELSDPREVLRCVRDLRRDDRFYISYDIVVDCSHLARVPDRKLIERYARLSRKTVGGVRHGRIAICASSRTTYGLARIFEMLSGVSNEYLCAFRTEQQAAAWLCA